MQKSYEKQILNYNVEKFNLIVKDNKNIFFFTKTLTKVNKNATLQVNSIYNVQKIIKDLKQYIGKDKYIRLCHS